MSDDPYVYAGTNVLKNKFGIRDRAALDRVERRFVYDRMIEGVPSGDFDLAHLQAIHKHLFQDVYGWAGEVRTVEISKGGHAFMFCRFIRSGMADVHRRVTECRYLEGLGAGAFALEAGTILGDVNHIHPFREGNGRTQLQYLKQLAERAGHAIDLTLLPPKKWISASERANQADYDDMRACIASALVERRREPGSTKESPRPRRGARQAKSRNRPRQSGKPDR